MKKLAFGVAVSASVFVAGSALAADLPAPAYKAPAVAPFAYNWTGFYIGGNAGWVGSANSTVTNVGTDTGAGGLGSVLAGGGLPASVNVPFSGFLGGGQIGYNWQINYWVVGLEADADWVSARGSTTVVFPGGPFVPNTSTYSRELDWLGTFRGRVGVTATPSLLLYATGGLAVGQTRIGSTESCPAANPPCSSEPGMTNQSSNTAVGWTVGAGTEWMFAPHWSLKAEYLYVDLGSHSSTIIYTYGANSSTLTSTVRDTENIARAGVNYHF